MDYLRRNYEDDKRKLEIRLIDEKTKAEKRYNELLEEYELKFLFIIKNLRYWKLTFRWRRKSSNWNLKLRNSNIKLKLIILVRNRN